MYEHEHAYESANDYMYILICIQNVKNIGMLGHHKLLKTKFRISHGLRKYHVLELSVQENLSGF